MKNLLNEISHAWYIFRYMAHDYYWNQFSYADNRICIFLENYLPKRIVRGLAFHLYHITMCVMSWVIGKAVNTYIRDIPTAIPTILLLVLVIANCRFKGIQRRNNDYIRFR